MCAASCLYASSVARRPVAARFQVTPDGTAYSYSDSNGTVTVAAPPTWQKQPKFFWASTGTNESNTTACATFSGGQDYDQPGIAMDHDDGRQAVTVTENIFSSGGSPRNQFNFDTWNTADSPAFTEFATTTITGLPSSPATWPLNMCAQITGDLVQFVVWTSGTQPAWGDPTWGRQHCLLARRCLAGPAFTPVT